MTWWMWILFGLGLLVAETATPGGFFALFFGVAALLVGGLALLGLSGPAWLEWLLFSAFAVALLTLRRPLQRRLEVRSRSRRVDSLSGSSAVVTEDIEPGGIGKVELRGASWSARSGGAELLGRGRRCIVDRVDGLTLWVRPE